MRHVFCFLRISSLGSLCLLATCFASIQAMAADEDWMYDVTVLTVASGGAWGSATRSHTGAAIAAAIADCRERAGGTVSDCGARQTYVRNGWILGYACGDRVFSVSGRSLQEARVAGVNQEIRWREEERIDIPACSPIVAIGPDGKAADPALATRDVLPVIGERRSGR